MKICASLWTRSLLLQCCLMPMLHNLLGSLQGSLLQKARLNPRPQHSKSQSLVAATRKLEWLNTVPFKIGESQVGLAFGLQTFFLGGDFGLLGFREGPPFFSPFCFQELSRILGSMFEEKCLRRHGEHLYTAAAVQDFCFCLRPTGSIWVRPAVHLGQPCGPSGSAGRSIWVHLVPSGSILVDFSQTPIQIIPFSREVY